MSLSKVRSAMIQGFTNAALGLPFASENKAFTPPVDAPWSEVCYVPGVPTMGSIGSLGMDELEGYLEVRINVPLNSGTEVVMTKADALRAYFFAGRALVYQGQEVRIKGAGTKPGYKADNSWKTPTVIRFYAQIPRTA